MPLFMVEHLIIALNPNCPKGGAIEKVPNLNLLDKLLRISFPTEGLFLVEVVVVAGSHPPQSSYIMNVAHLQAPWA